MKVKKLIQNIIKAIEIAFEECCLNEPHSQVSFISASGCMIVKKASPPLLSNQGQLKTIDVEVKIKRRWNGRVEIWTRNDKLIKCHQCHITELVDKLMETKEALLREQ